MAKLVLDFFGKKYSHIFKVADKSSADNFAWEQTVHDNLLVRTLPFGIHDYEQHFPDVMTYFDFMQKDSAFFNRVFKYKNNQKLFFDRKKYNVSPYIKSGFSEAGEDFSWTSDKNVEFVFQLENYSYGDEIYVNFELQQYFGLCQFVNIYINSKKLCLKIVKEKEFGFSFNSSEDKVEICLEFLNPFIPDNFKIGADIRMLGIAVKTMWMEWGNGAGKYRSTSFYGDHSSYYIYGAGKIAQQIIESIAVKNLPKPVAVLVTDKANNPDSICGIPVVQADEVQNKSLWVLIAVSQKFYDTVVDNLRNLGFYNC